MASESFTYSDGNLATVSSGVWATCTGAQAMRVASGAVTQATTGGSDAGALYNTSTGSNDHWVEATISSFASTNFYVNMGVVARSDATGQNLYFAVRTSENGIDIYKTVGGSWGTGLVGTYSLSKSAAAGVLRLECIGSAIKAYWDGVQIISVTDTTHTTGAYTGVASYWQDGGTVAAVTLDNWQNGVPVGTINASIAATIGNVIGDIDLTYSSTQVDMSLAATIDNVIGDIDLTYTPVQIDASIAATIGDVIGDIDLTSSSLLPIDASIAATIGNVIGDIDLTYTPGQIDASILAVIGNVIGDIDLDSGGAPFPYPVSRSGKKLLDQNGLPYQLANMSVWGMSQNATSLAQITTALEGLYAAGFRSVSVAPIAGNYNTYGGSGWVSNTNSIGGGSPFFTGTAFRSSLNSAGWGPMDWIMTETKRLGMVVLLAVTYTGYNNDQGIGTDLVSAYAASPTNCYNYGVNVATRYPMATYPNIVWQNGADYNYNFGTQPGPAVDQVFKGIRDTEGSTHRLILCEPMQPRTTYDQFISQSQPGVGTTGYGWMLPDINSIYNYNFSTVEQFDSVYTESGTSAYPVWDCEPPYRGAGWTATPSEQELRERVYSTFIRGGIGINYGDADLWPFGKTALGSGGNSSVWGPVLTRDETVRTGRAYQFAATYMNDLTWVPSNFIVTGFGSGDTKAAGGNSATKAVAYFPNSRTIAVNTTLISATGNVRLRWFDPTNGAYTLIAGSEAKNVSRSITYPGTNSDGDSDWVLLVDLPQRTIKVGTVTPTVIKRGTTTVTKVMVGTTQVWP